MTAPPSAPRCACPTTPLDGCPAPRRQLSYNYLPDGTRVNTQGGTYWIPATEYASVVARAQYDPAILNAYRFVPLGSCPSARRR